MKTIQFQNCYLLRDHKLVKDDLWVRGGKIINPEKVFFDEKIAADEKIDCKGAIISAGYIDIQINGAFGVDFSDGSDDIADGLDTVAKGLLAHGVTSFCPTLITSPKDVYQKVLPKLYKRNGSKDGAGVLGAHVEGPFISKEKKGAHCEEFIKEFPNGFADVVSMYGSLDSIAMTTLAPEKKNSDEVIQEFVKRDITVCVGHSIANLVQGENAVCKGAVLITHLFNAMLPFHHRDPHLLGLLTSKKLPNGRSIFYGLIADGIHTHPAAIRIAYRVHPDGLVLVTDAIPAMGLPQGEHHIGSQKVEIKGLRAVIAGTETLCGSIITMESCVKHLLKNTECGKEFALECATLHPALALGITDKKGTLDFGSDADFILLDEELNVLSTYIAGENVWTKNSS